METHLSLSLSHAQNTTEKKSFLTLFPLLFAEFCGVLKVWKDWDLAKAADINVSSAISIIRKRKAQITDRQWKGCTSTQAQEGNWGGWV